MRPAAMSSIRFVLLGLIVAACVMSTLRAVDDQKSLFPIALTFEVLHSEKAVKVTIENVSDETLILDWRAIKKIELDYWFKAGGRLVGARIGRSTLDELDSEAIRQMLSVREGPLIKVPPGGKLSHTISLKAALDAVRPLISEIPADGRLSLNVTGQALSVGRIEDNGPVFDERLYSTIFRGEPRSIAKRDLAELVK